MRIFKSLIVGIAALALLAGCAQPPTAEIAATKAALDALNNPKAQTYVSAEIANAKKIMADAEKELKVQEDKFFKNYDLSKQILANAKKAADDAQAQIQPRYDAAKKAAEAASVEAKAALDEATALLAQAPKGKGSKADIEMMQADLKALTDSYPEVATLIGQENFAAATDKARSIQAKSQEISAQVKAAIEKKAASKGKKK